MLQKDLPYLIDGSEVSKETFGATEQGLIIRTNDQVTDVSLGAKRIKQQFLPVGQSKRREHQKVVLVTHQEGWDGQGLRRLVCAFQTERREKGGKNSEYG